MTSSLIAALLGLGVTLPIFDRRDKDLVGD
jgi:hypothetical protein